MSKARRLHEDGPLRCIEEMMLADDAGDENSVFHLDPSALKAWENSFYRVLCNDKASFSEPQDPCTDCYDSTTVCNLADSLNRTCVPSNTLSWPDSVSQFRAAVGEAGNFLPRLSNPSIADIVSRCTKSSILPLVPGEEFQERDDLCELFDNLYSSDADDHVRLKNQQLQQAKSMSVVRPMKRQRTNVELVVELESLLLHCGKAVANDDRITANEVLKQIRKYSSPLGIGIQRCAHYFAIGLEARLTDTAMICDSALGCKLQSAADLLKAYDSFRRVCPFRTIFFDFASSHIFNLAQKTKTLHIIDFGLNGGFRWIHIIKGLSTMSKRPPKLRVTGIDSPWQSAWKMQLGAKTGVRMSRYCKRFGVSFEYNNILTHNWDQIQLEDLKIDQDEAVVIICMLGFEGMLDKGEWFKCPKDDVLTLISKMNPDIFIHSVANSNFNLPLFSSRFTKALRNFLVYFDLLDVIFSKENQDRLWVENELIGRPILNVIACEGAGRVVRPEGYKRWQTRTESVGFRQWPLDRKQIQAMRAMLKDGYHKDYMLMEDGHWLVLGWKGHSLLAICCWCPTSSLS